VEEEELGTPECATLCSRRGGSGSAGWGAER
jgi:hypothetical protein